MLFNLSKLNSNLELTVGYFNPALNNSAQDSRFPEQKFPGFWIPQAKISQILEFRLQLFKCWIALSTG